MGYYRDGVVYFKAEIAETVNKYLLRVALEECAHHVTEATDMSRDFQDYLIACCVEMKA
jgi:hypothetical protein